uniref:VWFA domain-containing protein n=1 Tax=Amphiprion ocellaris TaxID=80972 RepID=A0AAQ5Y9M5_AMPOC
MENMRLAITHFSVESNNARQLVATAAGNIEKLLNNRSQALKRLAAEAEKFQKDHEWRDDTSAFLFSFVQLNQTEKNRYVPDDFHTDPDFKRPVSYNTTAVHIPTDIYEGSTIILNELNWTEALEDVFRKNKEEDPSLLWQVFGSATGLARYYPASPWVNNSNLPHEVDLYDVLLWQSGSVSGLTLKLIRTSVSRMLETLSDDDYVNVVYFNDKATYAACFQNLVQANVRNKKILKDAVQNITAKGITNYTGGFELAFEQLAQMNVSRANCNKIIMLFTDGGEERAEEIFQKYNPKQVRIFTFSVGQHNYDKGPIQWMACANKGYYYEIPSIGAIRINTQEYLDVLGRPMVKADRKAKQVQWTNVYLDALKLGLVITGTLPVFNKTNTGSKSQNQLILGVMAIDVSLEDIKRLTPRFTFGPNGYYFAIDPNGYVLLHPNLQPPVGQIPFRATRYTAKFHEPVTLDFLDAELENEIKVEIRKNMIDGRRGNYTISTLVKSQDERYIDQGQRTYTYAPVKGTDYSLMADKFDEYGYTFIAPRVYCKDLKPPDKNTNNTEFLMEFNNYIDTKTPNNPMSLFSLFVRHGVLARFVATDGGITRVYPKSAGFYWKEDAETYESSFYKRSLDNDLYIFTPTPYLAKENATSDDSVLVSKAVNLKIDDIVLKPAGKDTHTHTHRPTQRVFTFLNLISQLWIRSWERNIGLIFSVWFQYVDCVILDDGGFLVMSNREEYISQIGRFFGVIDPILMKNLVNSSLFTSKSTYDYQSLCDPEKESKAAAGLRSVYVPTIADILNLGWWATACVVLDKDLNIFACPSTAEMDDEVSDAMRQEVCITEQTQYFFETDNLSFRGSVDCENCSRLYHAEKLPKTNLVFIITDAKGTCTSCDTKPLIQDEQQSNGPNPCEMALNPRYRKGPAVCFDNNEHEEDPDCGGVSGLSPSLWLMVALQLLLLWVVTDSRHHAIPS